LITRRKRPELENVFTDELIERAMSCPKKDFVGRLINSRDGVRLVSPKFRLLASEMNIAMPAWISSPLAMT